MDNFMNTVTLMIVDIVEAEDHCEGAETLHLQTT